MKGRGGGSVGCRAVKMAKKQVPGYSRFSHVGEEERRYEMSEEAEEIMVRKVTDDKQELKAF